VTHRRSGAGSDGVELELAALRGRVAMVEAERAVVVPVWPRDLLVAGLGARR
jgi:hypothetical protein